MSDKEYERHTEYTGTGRVDKITEDFPVRQKFLRICFKVNYNGFNYYIKHEIPTSRYTVSKRIYRGLITALRTFTSIDMGLPLDAITPITINEYLDNYDADRDKDIK